MAGLGLSVPPAAKAGAADITSIITPNSIAAIFLFN